MAGNAPAPYDHYRLADADVVPADATPGIYRVVGTDDESVTLLRVTDGDGRRRHTGELLTIDDETLSAFEPTENPDGNRALGATIASQLDGLVWQLRAFGQSLADRPVLSTAAGIVLAAGLVGEQFVAGPDWWFGVAVFAGSLGLAAIGSHLL
jgi:hypothetical protein